MRGYPKPAKGTAKLARIVRARDREAQEDQNKRAAKKRDGYKCRRPQCPVCREYGRRLGDLHAAHWRAKGIGGDPTLQRSERRHFITLDPISHPMQERHELILVPLDDERLMDGPVEFWRVLPDGTRVFDGVSEP